jgi:hypothetical protein
LVPTYNREMSSLIVICNGATHKVRWNVPARFKTIGSKAPLGGDSRGTEAAKTWYQAAALGVPLWQVRLVARADPGEFPGYGLALAGHLSH